MTPQNATLKPRNKKPRKKLTARRKDKSRGGKDGLNRLIESDLIRRVSFENYRQEVRRVYDGPQGALLATASLLSLHSPLSERWLRSRRFDLRGCQRIFDVGSGAGQLVMHLLKYSDPRAAITCFDLSREMLRRARSRMRPFAGDHPLRWAVGDLSCLPFADNSFDCITCGYVLEHLPEARSGLSELTRVLEPGGRMLLLTTEDSFGGAWTSRFWHCRTYNRDEIRGICNSLGLDWKQELWFSPLHRAIRAGGICVELQKRG